MERTVHTASLVLRPFEPGDRDPYAAICADPEVVRWLPGGAERATRADEIADRLVADFAAQWNIVGYGPWAVIERETGRLVGHAGLRRLPQNAGETAGETEILYMLAASAWGRGLATEAAIAARDLALGPLGLPRVIAMTRPDNVRSIRVMEKAGLHFERVVTFAGLDAVLHAAARCRAKRG